MIESLSKPIFLAVILSIATSATAQEEIINVKGVARDNDGVTKFVCNYDEEWKIKSMEDAWAEIASGTKYFALCPGDVATLAIPILVKQNEDGQPYLQTIRDGELCNNLDDLPTCAKLQLEKLNEPQVSSLSEPIDDEFAGF